MKTLLFIISTSAVFILTQNNKAEEPAKKISPEIPAAYSDSVLKEERMYMMKDKMK